MKTTLLCVSFCLGLTIAQAQQAPDKPFVSGIYPHLTMFNDEGECGTGAVVPWANRLWAITYAPHRPNGSSDKLYEITPELKQIIRPESIGGTPANRMIHRESKQLFIGPYVIDPSGNVRIPKDTRNPERFLYGRLTANMRHLTDPAGKIYYATMEEGIYEVDVKTLAAKELNQDGNREIDAKGKSVPGHSGSKLPGYHGKGAYTAQGRVVYANNGDTAGRAQWDPSTPSGVLAQWNGTLGADGWVDWKVVRRNQFTEVTGPGGIEGNANPNDPLWSVGWDYRSLLLQSLDGGQWHTYRLPKGSHSYDGAHGWNTEWPRIRDIGEKDLLMTMHGTFWRFPKTFTSKTSSGIAPLSNYMKVVGDFCRWGDWVVLGCDDSAKAEFYNKRRAKGTIGGPGQSNSNLWFLKPSQLATLGPALGRGAVWFDEDVSAGTVSDAYLLEGYALRTLQMAHRGTTPVDVLLEVDAKGNGTWTPAGTVTVTPGKIVEKDLSVLKGAWVRLTAKASAKGMTAYFQYAAKDTRGTAPAPIFSGLAGKADATLRGGLPYVRGERKGTLGLAAMTNENGKAEDVGFYELSADLRLRRLSGDASWVKSHYPINGVGVSVEPASALVVDDKGRRWRFPKADPTAYDKPGPLGPERVCREVCTERDLLNLAGIFYELPAENAGGFSKARALSTHNTRIHDFASWRGLLVLTGVKPEAKADGHVIVSDDGKASVWVGAIDDLWSFGKPRGEGGPWLNTSVKAGEPSDPYLMTGFDRKTLRLSHNAKTPVTVTLELDLTGTGVWHPYATYTVPAGETLQADLGQVRGYWLRVRADRDCTATAWLRYE